MEVCVNYPKNLNYGKSRKVNFVAQSIIQKNYVNKQAKKVLPFAFVAMLLGLLGTSCTNVSNRQSEKYNLDGISVEFTEVQPATRDSILMPILDLKSKLIEKNDFLNNLGFDVDIQEIQKVTVFYDKDK